MSQSQDRGSDRQEERADVAPDVSTAVTDPRGRWDDDGGNSQLPATQEAGIGARALLAEDGPHVGRGPRRDRQVDARTYDDACEALTRHGGLDASGITCAWRDGVIHLSGTVADDEQKKLAVQLVSEVQGVRGVEDHLAIAGPASVAMPETAPPGDADAKYH